MKRIISLLMVALMLATSVPYVNLTVGAVDEETETYTLTLENTLSDSLTAESSAVGGVSFFGSREFDGCYGNQLDGVSREIYDSLVKNYATDKITVEYNHTFETPFTFNAEISGGSIVMNDELEEISAELSYAVQVGMDAFLYDHPEVFWLRIISSSYSISASGNSVDGYTGYIEDITITPTEIYTGASSKITQYDTAVNSALAGIAVTESIYDTLKSLHDYICNNAYYNLIDDYYVHSSEAFFIGDGGVVCEGYAKTFKVLCDRLDIPCVLVSGDAGGAHMWNYVQMDDDKWYLVDATWDDQDSKIYDTYFLANASTVGFNDVAISEERTEKTDFSGTGMFSFTYPVLSSTAYTVHTHEWESEYTVDVEPTCAEKGSKSIHCKTCDATQSVTEIATTDHLNKTEHPRTDATCTKKGYSAGVYCSDCGEWLEGHDEIPATGHDYESVVTAPTCTAKGYTTHTCSVCSEGYTDTFVSATGHKGGTATCKVKAKCTVCKASYGSLNANNHQSLTTLKAVASTCTKTGLTEGKKCTDCGTITVAQKEVAKKAHSYKTTTTKATFTRNGKTETKCTVCGFVSKTTTIYYPKTITLSTTAYTYNGKNKTPSVTVKDSKGNTLKKDTDYTVKYESGRKVPGKYTVTVTFKGKYSGTKTLYFTIVPKVTSKVTASQTTSTITLKWNKVTGADGYRVFKYNSKTKKYEKLKDVSGTSLKISKLKAGTKYKFKVRAYTKDDGIIWGAYSSVFETATRCKTPTLKVTSSSKGKALLSWTNVSGESGYQVYYSTKKDSGYKKLASYKTNVVKGSKSKLSSKKTYYFKVRAYTKTNSGTVYSAWSSVKSIKIK